MHRSQKYITTLTRAGYYRCLVVLLAIVFVGCDPQEAVLTPSVDQEARALLVAAADKQKTNPDLAILLVDSCLHLPDIEAHPKFLYEANYIKCTTLPIQSPVQEVIGICQKAMKFYGDQQTNQRDIGVIANSMGVHYQMSGQVDSAMHYFQMAERIFKQSDDKYWLSEVYNNWGILFSQSAILNEAIGLFVKALDYSNEADNTKAKIAAHINLGNIYYQRRRYPESEEHFFSALDLARDNNIKQWEAKSLVALANVYYRQKEYVIAEEYYVRSYLIAEDIKDSNIRIEVSNSLAEMFLEIDECDSSIDFLKQAHLFIEQSGQYSWLGATYNTLGQVYLEMGKMEEAEEALRRAVQSGRTSRKELIRNSELMSDLYVQKGDYALALQQRTRYEQLSQSLNSTENAALLAQLETQYETKKKEETIGALQEKNMAQQRFLILLVVLGIVTVIFLAVTTILYMGKKRLNTTLEHRIKERTLELQDSNLAMERFAYIASHDLKTPLRTISSFLTLIKRKIQRYKDQELEELLTYASNGAKQMNQLIEDVLEYSKVSHYDMEVGMVSLDELLQQILDGLQEYTSDKNAVVNLPSLPTITGNRQQLSQLFQNLIVNGIKYNTSSQPTVNIIYQATPTKHTFVLEDNGIGVAEEYHEMIFEMFKRLHSTSEYEGTGIGLALCRKIVENHHGKISLTSGEGEGSKFYFTLAK